MLIIWVNINILKIKMYLLDLISEFIIIILLIFLNYTQKKTKQISKLFWTNWSFWKKMNL